MDKWKEIWNKDERIHKILLETLIKADGFDSGAGSFTVDDWIVYTDELYHKMNIVKGDTVYDIGCGSGAFVYPLFLENHKVGGVDYSTILIQLASMLMPHTDFINKDALDIEISLPYDIVVSHSVFHYFKDLTYAKNVIEKMIDKSAKKIAIFDINDATKEDTYHMIRKGNMSQNEYSEKYAGLDHMFYTKEWFEDIAKEFGVKINIFDQSFTKYTNAKLRFNVIMERV